MKTTNDNAENTISIKESDFNTVDGKKFELDSKFNSYKGQVEMYFPDGRIYKGHLENGKFNGHGELTYADGGKYKVYEGEFKDGIRDGQGKLTFKNENVYEGNFKDGVRDGQGKLTFKNENVYEGEFKKNKFNGQGEFTMPSTGIIKGDFKDNLPSSGAELVYLDGDVYKGNFRGYTAHGQGVLTYAEGKKDKVYEGNFEKGLFHGQGKLIYKNGNVYNGEFKDGQFNGQGEYIRPDKIVSYKGEFKNGSAYIPDLHQTKKEQTILLISDLHRNAHFNSLTERYEEVISLDKTKTNTINADLLKKSISNATKGEKKKLKIVINTHGAKDGELGEEKFILETLHKALEEIKDYKYPSEHLHGLIFEKIIR